MPAANNLALNLYYCGSALAIMGWGAFVMVLAAVFYPLTTIAFRRAISANWHFEQLRGSLENQRIVLETVRDSVSVSDAAKQIAFRHKDRDALRHAIREDLDKNDYDGAIYLVNAMDRTFGYHEEAAALRREIDNAKRGYIDNQVRESLDVIDHSISTRDWPAAVRNTELLLKRYPYRPEVQRMPERINTARDSHKRELLKQWTDAAARDDVDRSIELLRQLDQYLTPGEAEAYKDTARDVFKKRLQQLSVQFSLHSHDKNWSEAVRVGRQITDEFPNSRIATEVRGLMPILQENLNKGAQATPVVNMPAVAVAGAPAGAGGTNNNSAPGSAPAQEQAVGAR